MGGSISKKRTKSKLDKPTSGSQQSPAGSNGGDHHVQDRTVPYSTNLATISNSIPQHDTLDRQPSPDVDNFSFLLDTRDNLAKYSPNTRLAANASHEACLQYPNPPPPYSEVDPLASASGFSGTTVTNRKFAFSIPNLMDIDPEDIDEALQPGGWCQRTPFRGPSTSGHQSREDLPGYEAGAYVDYESETRHGSKSRSLSNDGLASSNPNLVDELDNQVKSKKNWKKNEKKNKNSNCQKPPSMVKKREFRSNPNIFSSNSEFSVPRKHDRFQKSKQKSSGNSSGNANGRRNKVITPQQLTDLSRKSDQEILFRIQNFSTGFMRLLEETEYSDDVLVMVMGILGKVCRNDDCPHTANAILQTALYTNLFNVRMVTYLQTAPYNGSMDENPTLLQNLLVVFTTVLREFKTEAEQKLGNCLTLGRQAINQVIGPSGDLDDELIQELRNLTDVQRLNTCKASVMAKEFPAVFNVSYEPPPGVETKTSTEYKHHLLVLLQKEFVDTLRMVEEKAEAPQPVLYRRVHVIGTDCTSNEGLVHKLSFDTEGHETSWNDTTKLLVGSTVFISRNLRQEMHCAVVMRRCPEELSLGHVWVKLLDWQSPILQCAKPFDMLENFTYKDDFVSLMEALHLQLEYPLPFTNHILGMKKNVSHPKYLDTKSSFSFSFLPSNGKEVKKKFSALNPNTWPCIQSFGPFQEGFKHALTKELAIIHSSSETEAIKFGSYVLKALLCNEELWHSSQTPITVIFHSDRSLDDFLKDILTSSPKEKIIRMGGNCQDALLNNYSLNVARDIVCNTEDFPTYVMQNKRILHAKMRKLKSEIAYKMDLLEKARVHLLNSEALKNHIATNHSWQLQSLNMNSDSDPILQWLSNYTIQELQCLQSEHAVLGEPSKAEKPKSSKKKPGKSDETCGSVLSHTEMNRRTTAFPSEEFDDSGKSFNQEPSLLNADDSFITQDQMREDILLRLKGKQYCLSDIIKLELERKDVMHDSEVEDLFLLGSRDRWRLYRHWLSKFESCIRNELSKLQKKYEKSFLQMQEVIREIDVSILRRARVVGLTIASAAKHHRLFKMVAPRIVIIEEAGKIAEPSLIANLTEQCWHLILIGDHSQLRPALNGFRSSDTANHPRTISLFEKLISKGVKYVSLSDSHSMTSSVQNALKYLFPNMPCLSASALAPPNSAIRGMSSDIFFINNSCPDSLTSTSSCCYTNEYEANFLVSLSKYLVSQGYSQAQITILSTCIGQVQLMLKLSKQNNLDQLTCASVEDYQGKSNDIVLLSLVRSNDHGDVGPMADDNYMSVAMTRARSGLYCIGNFKMLVDSLASWKAHITFLAGQQLYGSTLTLKCGWHPTQTYEVNSCESLKSAVSGICKQPCHASLECGHKCMKKCHADDRDHKSIQCGLPCGKVACPAGHKCLKKCFETCPPCQMSFKKMQSCGHEAVVKCSQLQQKTKCTEKCKKTLACGHACPKQCSEKCDVGACTFINEYHESHCKHVFFVSCSQMRMSNLEKLCPKPCAEKLLCGHTCTGTCGQCQQGRMHIPCKAKCESVMLCGHRCQEPCGNNCLPCKITCNRRCDHATCNSVCGSTCIPCLEPCGWQCAHKKCSKMCFELCDRVACNFPCTRVLPCRHPCIGFCGEPCPPLCRVCDRAEILQGMPGSKHIGTARFVLLEDCNHVVEVITMNKIMQGNRYMARFSTVEVKTCPMPLCGTPIRKCIRYGNDIKKTLIDVTKIIHQCKEGESGLSMPLRDLRIAIKALPETKLTAAVRQLNTEAQQNLSCQQAIVLENKYNFLVCMQGLWRTNIRLLSDQDWKVMLLSLEETLMGLSTTSSQMTLDAFVMELKRAMYLIHVYQSLENHPSTNISGKILFSNLCKYLVDTKTFNAAAEAIAVRQIKRLYAACKIPSDYLEDIVSVSASDVQPLIAGHWTKCNYDHFNFAKQYTEGQDVQCKTCARYRGQ